MYFLNKLSCKNVETQPQNLFNKVPALLSSSARKKLHPNSHPMPGNIVPSLLSSSAKKNSFNPPLSLSQKK